MTSKKSYNETAWRILACAGVVLSSALMMSCSRHEKPKTVEKKIQAFDISPTALPVKPDDSVVHTNLPKSDVVKGDSASPRKMVMMGADQLPQKPQRVHVPLSPETRQKMQAKQQAVMEQVLQRELAKANDAYDQEGRSLEQKELELRQNDTAVRDAYAGMMASRSEYEQACEAANPGYAALKQEVARLQAQMNEASARRSQGVTANAGELSEIRKQLNSAMSEFSKMRLTANTADAGVKKALQKVIVVQNDYQSTLLKNEDYSQARRKSDAAYSVITNLTSEL